MEINHRFAARNEQELKMVRAIELASEILEDRLNVKIVLQAQRQPGWAGADAFHAGMYVSEERLVKINFRNLTGCSAKTVLTVLGHEFRHAVQYQHGLMERGVWRGPKTDTAEFQYNGRFSRYYNRPQEVDARMYQEPYANLVLEDSRFSLMAQDLNVPGDVMMKRDYEATFRKLGFAGIEDPDRQTFNLGDGRFSCLRLSEVFPNKKKWTKALAQRVFREHRELLERNVFEYIMVPVTIDDFVS